MADLSYIAGVSWPRSGHHLLVRILQEYFREDFEYCEFYTPDNCCRTFPCSMDGKINFSKSHDWGLHNLQTDSVKYLIQVRNFIPALVSSFEIFVENGGEDSELRFVQFASDEWTRYRLFVRKWVSSDFAKKQIVLRYEDLIEDPVNKISPIIDVIEPNASVDTARLHEIVMRTQIKNQRDVRDFRFFREELFDTLGKLHLGRNDVESLFEELLDRRPDARSILALQCLTSINSLENMIRRSEEYALMKKSG